MLKASRARPAARSVKSEAGEAGKDAVSEAGSTRSLNSEVSKSGSRLKRLGASFSRKGKTSLLSKSRGFLNRIQEKRRGSSPRNLVLRNLLKHRQDLHDPEGEVETDVETEADSASVTSRQSASRSSLGRGKRMSAALDAVRDLSGSGDTDADGGPSPSPAKRPRSIIRTSVKRRNNHEQRASRRGLTSEEGLLTREEAMSFSTRYSLTRSRAMTAEEVLGRNSISVKSLIRFAKHGDVDKVVAIVESEMVAVDAALEDGKTALMVSAAYGHTSTVVALYGLQADLECEDVKGNTALIKAADKGQLEVVLTLLSCGADAGRRNKRSETALLAAAKHIATADSKRQFQDYLEIVRAFFERSAPAAGACAIAEFDPATDEALIADVATRTLLNEWLQARLKRKDLHVPSYATFKSSGGKLGEFFNTAHNRLDMWGWIKVTLLLLFIVYDTYSPHFSNTYTTLAVYVGLYICAYNL